jgi:hypothetical protein
LLIGQDEAILRPAAPGMFAAMRDVCTARAIRFHEALAVRAATTGG